LALGIPIAELRETITARELAEWAAFERVFGPITVQERVDAAAGIAGWAAMAAAGVKDKNPRDFMPDWARAGTGESPKQPPEEMIAIMRGLKPSASRKRKRKDPK
jgi:hypothetical protein